MRKTQEAYEITEEFKCLLQNLQDLADKVSCLGQRIMEMPVISNQKECTANFKSFLSGCGSQNPCVAVKDSSKIIPFPESKNLIGSGFESGISGSNGLLGLTPFLGSPGKALPPNIPDCRPVLQRDGLILLAWDKRVTETGELYTAYWVTSNGIPRFYASKPLLFLDFYAARPCRKSYAAEDGIDFYGQKAPAYMVHVAPELMKSNPRHKELRKAHIDMLKNLGSKVNFNYKFLLKTDKKRKAPSEAPLVRSKNRAG